MKIRIPKRKRLVRGLAIFIILVLVLLFVGFPTAVGFYATRSRTEDVGAAPDGFTEMKLLTEDGVEIGAWYAPPQNGAVIILVHGAGGSRDGMRRHANYLYDAGYGVLAIDLRGHGASGGQANLFGWKGTLDVGAAVDFLSTQADVSAIGGLGSSLGAEVLLGAVQAYPEIRAIVSDGATSRCLDEYMALPKNRSLYRNFTYRVLTVAVGVFSGDDPPFPLLDSMMGAENTEFLFIAGGKDAEEVEFNELFADKVGERGTLWIVSDAGHTGALSRHPDDYKEQVIAFFDRALLEIKSP